MLKPYEKLDKPFKPPINCRISPPSLPCHVAEPLGRQAVAVLGHQQGQLPQQLIELDSFQASGGSKYPRRGKWPVYSELSH